MLEAHSERPTSATWLLERRCRVRSWSTPTGVRPSQTRKSSSRWSWSNCRLKSCRIPTSHHARQGAPRPAEDCRMVASWEPNGAPGLWEHGRSSQTPDTREMRDRVNTAIKYRDWWRPFAPSMLPEAAERLPRRRILRSVHDRDVPGEGTSPARDWRGGPSRWHDASSDGQA